VCNDLAKAMKALDGKKYAKFCVRFFTLHDIFCGVQEDVVCRVGRDSSFRTIRELTTFDKKQMNAGPSGLVRVLAGSDCIFNLKISLRHKSCHLGSPFHIHGRVLFFHTCKGPYSQSSKSNDFVEVSKH